MTPGSHRIKRQVVELSAPLPELARRAQDEISRIQPRRVAPIVERVCSEVSEETALFRLDRVEVDLGAIPEADLENTFCDRLEAALRRALSASVAETLRRGRADGSDPRVTSALEVFVSFAKHGCLPWWADAKAPGVLADSARVLLREGREPLTQSLIELSREPAALRRIAGSYEEAVKKDLCALLAPLRAAKALSSLPAEIVRLLTTGKLKSDHPPSRLRVLAWEAVLRTATLDLRQGGASRTGPTALAGLCTAALVEISKSTRIPLRELFVSAILESSIADLEAVEPWDTESLEDAESAAGTESTEDAESHTDATSAEDAESDTCATSAADTKPTNDAASAADAKPPAATRSPEYGSEEHGPRDKEPFSSLVRTPGALPKERSGDGHTAPRRVFAKRNARSAQSPLRSREEGLRSPGGALDIDEPDELYVHDAGICILWPFLTSFFDAQGLLEKRLFRDEAARHRAIHLVAHLATGEPETPEYLLPLAKILCGVEPVAVIEPPEPLTAAEIEDCAELLASVIATGPILNEMSIDFFRGSFLLREGVLSSRDGLWLLRIARETYDIVLDDLPWAFDWVALPFMPAPLRVEWR